MTSSLIMLRDPLPHRLRQLHNPLSPIHTLPIEVLSYIFEQLVNLGRWDSRGISWDQQCLARALVVSSVSSHFRRVAFDTPELWKRIPLFLTNEATIGKASALLQHCIALAPYVNISVSDSLDKKEARSAIDVLLVPDATQKTKAFELFYSSHAPTVWMEKLKGSSFPMLDTLEIKHNTMGPNFDLGTLKTLTRLHISNQCLDRPIIVPESLQYLDIRYITRQAFTSLLCLCPNLVECIAFVDRQHSNHLDGDAQFTEPVTLRHLKQLTSDIVDVGETSSLTQNLQLPSLEILRLRHFQGSKFTTAIQLCRNVSATLTTLIINKTSGILDYNDLYQLCRIPFPKLRTLKFFSTDCKPFMRAIHALALPGGENSRLDIHNLPALQTITLRDSDMEPRSLLDLLKEWKIGDLFSFHILLDSRGRYQYCWSQEPQEELRSIVGNHRIEVTWGDS